MCALKRCYIFPKIDEYNTWAPTYINDLVNKRDTCFIILLFFSCCHSSYFVWRSQALRSQMFNATWTRNNIIVIRLFAFFSFFFFCFSLAKPGRSIEFLWIYSTCCFFTTRVKVLSFFTRLHMSPFNMNGVPFVGNGLKIKHSIFKTRKCKIIQF